MTTPHNAIVAKPVVTFMFVTRLLIGSICIHGSIGFSVHSSASSQQRIFAPRATEQSDVRTSAISIAHNPLRRNYGHTRQHGLVAPSRPFTTTARWLSACSASSLISPTDTWGNIAVLSTISTLALTVGAKTAIGRLLGPPVSGMAMAFLLASIGVLPSGGSQGAAILQTLSLNLATPLILLSADLRKSRTKAKALLTSFALASVSTWIASCVGILACRNMLYTSLSSDGLKVAAALMAKNIGGGINYIAVCQTLQVSPASIAAGLCVDNIMALVYFPVTSVLASGRPDVIDEKETCDETKDEAATARSSSSADITVSNASTALSIATIVTWLGGKIAGPTASIPCATALTLAVASLSPPAWVESIRPPAELLGTVLLYLFFATAGAPGMAIADSVRSSFVSLSCFLGILYGVHGGLLVACRSLVLWWRRKRAQRRTDVGDDEGAVAPQRLLVASSAAIGGPATAAALAQANGWASLVVPSILVGNIGYAIATFLGLAFHAGLVR